MVEMGIRLDTIEKQIAQRDRLAADLRVRVITLENVCERLQKRVEEAAEKEYLLNLAAETMQTMLGAGIGQPEEVAARAVRAAKELIRLVDAEMTDG